MVVKMVFDLDMDKCVACGACAIACMDQNDIWPEQGDSPLRVIGTLEPPLSRGGKISYLSLGCMHCSDAPCVTACPTGCLRKNAMNLSVFDDALCIGCHSCAMACPFGAPTFTAAGKMRKCDGCAVRLENGMIPACVRICPTAALTCQPEEAYLREKRGRSMRAVTERLCEPR